MSRIIKILAIAGAISLSIIADDDTYFVDDVSTPEFEMTPNDAEYDSSDFSSKFERIEQYLVDSL